MHASSLENMQKCYQKYVSGQYIEGKDKIQVVDIGGANVNGNYSDIFSIPIFTYTAADIDENANVDVLLKDPYKLPFANKSIDILISGQVFEHVEFFWLLFEEMARITKQDGYIFLITPSGGPIHRYPVDCYRFYPDAYAALAKYTNLHLIDSWQDERGPWKDLVGIFSHERKEKVITNEYSKNNHSRQKNRYELSTMPIVDVKRHEEDGFEVLSGDINYIEVLEKIHLTVRPEFYLEIGVRRGRSLSLSSCDSIAVDPLAEIAVELPSRIKLYSMTSDVFFDSYAENTIHSRKINLAFIDGMHLFEFVLRDFMNIEKYSDHSTVVVIDDIFPNHSLQASRERKTAAWTGDVWKIIPCLEEYRPDLKLTLLNTFPTGLLIVEGLEQNNRVLSNSYNPIVRKYKEMELDESNLDRFVLRKEAVSTRDYLSKLQ